MLKRQGSSLGGGGISNRFGMLEGVASTPTKVMRGEVKASGVELPNDEQLDELAVRFNGWLEDYRAREHKSKATSWFSLFSEVHAPSTSNMAVGACLSSPIKWLHDARAHKLTGICHAPAMRASLVSRSTRTTRVLLRSTNYGRPCGVR